MSPPTEFEKLEELERVTEALLKERIRQVAARIDSLPSEDELVARVKKARDQDAKSSWWRSSGAQNFLLAVVAVVAPVTVAINGITKSTIEKSSSEHEIVKANLTASLEEDALDDKHVRRMAFLASLDNEPGVLGDLGRWARLEHQMSLEQLARMSLEETEDFAVRLLDLAVARKRLLRSNGDYKSAQIAWARETDETKAKILNKHRNSIEGVLNRLGRALDDEKHSLQELRKENVRTRLLCGALKQSQPDEQHSCKSLRPLPANEMEVATKACDEALERKKSDNEGPCFKLGFLLSTEALSANDQSMAKNAADTFDKACAIGDGRGCARLADAFRLGLGRPKDLNQAADYSSKGCELQDAQACNAYGWRFFKGEGRKEDVEEARKMFTMSCQLRHMNGCDSLGRLLAQQARTEQDEARRKLEKQAIENFSFACGLQEVRACINAANLQAELAPQDFAMPIASLPLDGSSRTQPLPPPPEQASESEDRGRVAGEVKAP